MVPLAAYLDTLSRLPRVASACRLSSSEGSELSTRQLSVLPMKLPEAEMPEYSIPL